MFDSQQFKDPWDADNVDATHEKPFTDDGYVLTGEMKAKYQASVHALPSEGGMRGRYKMIFKNVSIFDVSGAKLTWSDLTPEDARGLQGVYYLLSEHKSLWDAPEAENLTTGWDFRSKDPNSRSPFEDYLPDFEPVRMSIEYVKSNAIARIVDGEIHTSRQLMSMNYG